MAAICHGISARDVDDIAERSGNLLGAVSSVLSSASWSDSPDGASGKQIADAVDRVEANYRNLVDIYGGWHDEEWTKAAAGANAKCFDFGGSFGMTAVQAAMGAAVVVLNAAAVHLRDGAESSRGDVARFVAEVRDGLAGVTPQEIEGYLRREHAVVEGAAETGTRDVSRIPAPHLEEPEAEPDGPAGIYSWRWQGRLIEVDDKSRMQPAWSNVAAYLWQRRGRLVPLADLVAEKLGASDESAARAGRDASRWFERMDVPITISTSERRYIKMVVKEAAETL